MDFKPKTWNSKVFWDSRDNTNSSDLTFANTAPRNGVKYEKEVRHLNSHYISCYRYKLKCSKKLHDLSSSPTILVLKRSETPISLAVKMTATLLLFEPDGIVTSLLRKLASVNPGPIYKISLFFFFCYIGKSILEQSTSQKLFFLGNSEFLQVLTMVWMLHVKRSFINTWFFFFKCVSLFWFL